jgi:DNA mismatch repair protein MutS2
MEFKVAVEELEQLDEEAEPAPARRKGGVRAPGPGLAPSEINLIGRHVEDAKLELAQFIGDAAAGGVETVRIVHGYGTGALRQGVREYLREDARVKSFQDADVEGGGGAVTIARLR